MIKRIHILSLAVVVGLYVLVAIWNFTNQNISERATIESELKKKIAKEANFWSIYREASAYRKSRQYHKAAASYRQALTIYNDHKDALYYAGSMHLLLKEYQQAETYWVRLQVQEPNAPRTFLRLGTLHSCMDTANSYFDIDKAINRIYTAWDLNREETGAPMMLAKLHLLRSDIAVAGSLLDDIVSGNKMSEQGLFLTGYIAWKQGNTVRAESLLNKAERYYRRQKDKAERGEGATKTGRAMLSEDRFCDSFEPLINELLQRANIGTVNSIYKTVDRQLNRWRTEFIF